jgi:hypothetical protein
MEARAERQPNGRWRVVVPRWWWRSKVLLTDQSKQEAWLVVYVLTRNDWGAADVFRAIWDTIRQRPGDESRQQEP